MASRSCRGSRTKTMPLSYGTLSHLCASVAHESASAKPSMRCARAGAAAAQSPNAPSTWTQARAWVHVDGAFGLWAAAAPARAHLMDGFAEADSWATDAHKWLNVPYDSGIVFVRDPRQLRDAMAVHAP